MPRYRRRVDLCQYPHPAGVNVASALDIQRDHDTLIFECPISKLEFDRLIKQHDSIATDE